MNQRRHSSPDNTLLVEICCEEIPARFVESICASFSNSLYRTLIEKNFIEDTNHSKVMHYCTPRRLTCFITNILCKQPDQRVLKRGPLYHISYDDKGNLTKAAKGFIKSLNASENQIKITEKTENKQGKWIAIERFVEGLSIYDEIGRILEACIKKLSLPNSMRWGGGEHKFIRPVKSVLAMVDNKICFGELFGLQISNFSLGHRFQKKNDLINKVMISSVNEYFRTLSDALVMVDPVDRKNSILDQCAKLNKEYGVAIKTDDVIEEVVQLVEYPIVLIGEFDRNYLSLPKELIIMTMAQHQKYFHIEDDKSNLINKFALVSNIKSDNHQIIINGNQKVIRPRFADAEFFYNADIKKSLNAYAKDLDKVIFIEGLGTLADRQKAITKLAIKINNSLKELDCDFESEEDILSVCSVLKADLMSLLVEEFPKMQGIAGYYYAKALSIDEKKAKAIMTHYQPKSADDFPPDDTLGQILSISDKMNTLVGFFAIGKNPTGEKDPFALRRQAFALIKTLLFMHSKIDLVDLIFWSINIYSKQSLKEKLETEDDISKLKEKLLSFFIERIKTYLNDNNGIISSIISPSLSIKSLNVTVIKNKFDTIERLMYQDKFSQICFNHKRLHNFLSRVDTDNLDNIADSIDVHLFEHREEKLLFDMIKNKESTLIELDKNKEYEALLLELLNFAEPIDKFFSNVLINVDDKKLQNNRISLLKKLNSLFSLFADFQQISYK